MNTVKQNLLAIKEDIVPYTPNIIAVTKYFDESKIIEAYEAGLRDFGESKVPEAIEKIHRLPKEVQESSRFHFIGHLQSNKVAKVVGVFDFIHSVDSLKLAEVVSSEAKKKGIVQKILLQVNNANEEQKFGFPKEELLVDFGKIDSLPNIEVVGLMNMAPFGLDEELLKELFEEVTRLKSKIEDEFNCKLRELSMGMSGDYKVAVAAGATMIRVGRILFSK